MLFDTDIAEVQYLSDLDATFFQVQRDLSLPDVFALFDVVRTETRSQNLLWDFRKGGMGQLTVNDLKEIIDNIRNNDQWRAGGATVVIMPDKMQGMLFGYFKLLVEVTQEIGITYHRCPSYEDGINWLRDYVTQHQQKSE